MLLQSAFTERIIVVSGHSHDDPGAIALDETTERSVVQSIGKYLMEEFDAWDNGFAEDFGVEDNFTLSQKIEYINDYCENAALDYKNSLLVSIHCDFSGASEGVASYFYTGSDKSKELATIISKDVAEVGDRRIKWVILQ